MPQIKISRHTMHLFRIGAINMDLNPGACSRGAEPMSDGYMIALSREQIEVLYQRALPGESFDDTLARELMAAYDARGLSYSRVR